MITTITMFIVGSGVMFYARTRPWYKAAVLSVAKAIVKRID